MKLIGDILYILGIILLVITVAVPVGFSIFQGREAGAAMAMLGAFTFFPGIILFSLGRALRTPAQTDGDTSRRVAIVRVLLAVSVLLLILFDSQMYEVLLK